MQKVLGESPKEEFPMPAGVTLVPVDLDPSNECVRVVMMAFVRGTEPEPCGPRRAVHQSAGTPPEPDPAASAPLAPPALPPAPGTPTPPPSSPSGLLDPARRSMPSAIPRENP
jgi:hypothetical protein